uniref:Ribosomal protein L32 n=1 Tax=Boodleopsis sp. FL1161 TaxID=2364084 RepID=A0A386AZB4_9CHLO|nr:ribosomal protein L32 [Boodleopsis sp. FL1161]
MAVPKKRRSKRKSNKIVWKKKALKTVVNLKKFLD